MGRAMTEERVYTIKEVASIVHVHPMTIYRMIKSGELPSFKVRGEHRIKQSALDRLMTEEDKSK